MAKKGKRNGEYMEKLYHWTTEENLKGISMKGFDVKTKKQQSGEYVFGLQRGGLETTRSPCEAMEGYEGFLIDKGATCLIRFNKGDIEKYGGEIIGGDEPYVKTKGLKIPLSLVEYDCVDDPYDYCLGGEKQFKWKKVSN